MTPSSISLLAAVAVSPIQVGAPSSPPVPPPIFSAPPAYRPPQRLLVAWEMGQVSCGGAPIVVMHRVLPSPSLSYVTFGERIASYTMTFRIDATGRPLGVRREGSGYVTATGDIAPSLVATRFASGAARSECRVDYTPRWSMIADAPIADIRAFAIAPNVRPDAEVFRRTYPAGTDCFDPAPGVRLRGYPPFEQLPATPGDITWSTTRFDIDRAGKPTRIATDAGSGQAALDQASRRAVAVSRFAPGVRHGCVYAYYRRPATLAAPELPAAEMLRPTDATCPLQSGWATKPVLVYPPAYNRRHIEGWAVVAFDVATWGATGNIRVLAAEPAADFGDSAVNLIRSATKPASPSGFTGCIERVQYKIARNALRPGKTDVPPPVQTD